MSMKLWSFNLLFLLLPAMFYPGQAWAQQDTLLYNTLQQEGILKTETDEHIVTEVPKHYHRYDKRIHRYRQAWEGLIPTHNKIQYAGGMGLLSIGPGWDYGKRGQWETDLLLGFIPKNSSKRFKITMTLKQNYIPWSIYLNDRFSLEPLECGLYFNTVFSDDFWTQEPDRYPKGYYGFSTRVRTHIFVGQRLRMDIPEHYRFFARSVTAFYEISSCDLYIVSAFLNNYLKPNDYLRLSFGLKFQIF